MALLTRARRRICVEHQTDIVSELLMSGGETDIRDDGRLIRCFDDRIAFPKIKEEPVERHQGNRAVQFVCDSGSEWS